MAVTGAGPIRIAIKSFFCNSFSALRTVSSQNMWPRLDPFDDHEIHAFLNLGAERQKNSRICASTNSGVSGPFFFG